jgi:nitrogen fixation protein FixH
MNVKINWGTGIALAFIGFGIFIVTLVVGTFGERVDLIEENYYEAEVRYQSRMEEMQRTEDMAVKPEVIQNGKALTIVLPGKDNTSGKARFLRPDNATFDFEMDINAGENAVDIQKLLPGMWIIQLHWETDGESFYHKVTHYFR